MTTRHGEASLERVLRAADQNDLAAIDDNGDVDSDEGLFGVHGFFLLLVVRPRSTRQLVAVERRSLRVCFHGTFRTAERHVVIDFSHAGARCLVQVTFFNQQPGTAASAAIALAGASELLGPTLLQTTLLQNLHGVSPFSCR